MLDFLAEDQRIPKVVTGIEEEDAQVGFNGYRHVQERHALSLKGCAHGDIGREGIHGPADDLLGCLRFELNRKRIHFFFVEHEQKLYPLYRTRSHIALFQKMESAICDRGYYIIRV